MHTEVVNRDDQDIKGKQRAYLDTIRRGVPYVIEVPVFEHDSWVDCPRGLSPVAVPELADIAVKTAERLEPQSPAVSLVLPTPRGNFRSSKTHEGLELPPPTISDTLWRRASRDTERLSVKATDSGVSIGQTFYGVVDERHYWLRVEPSWAHPVYHPFLEKPPEDADSVALAGVLVVFPTTRVCVAFSAITVAHHWRLAALWRQEQTPDSLLPSASALSSLYRRLTARQMDHHETQAVLMRSDMLALYKRCLLVVELRLGRDIANACLKGLSKGVRKYLNGVAAQIREKSPESVRVMRY